MRTILISGGNSGIGLQAAREFLARGHRVVLLGRSTGNDEATPAAFGAARNRASYFSVDLSSHDGVREAAKRILAQNDSFDAVLHTTGVFTMEDVRTTDGLHIFFAINYLSRYHLTQLLLPALRRAKKPRVVMMTARVPVSTPIDVRDFPKYEPFSLGRARLPIQVANHHYAAYLARTEPAILTGVANAGSAKTNILRMMPWYVRATATLLGPFVLNSLAKSAHNVVEASLRDDWPSPTYWDKPGDFERKTPIVLDASTTQFVIDTSRELTGV
jgi:NAD(P)-dependent dehydrogenase (short-subunit alcohol dehydrogenase family)